LPGTPALALGPAGSLAHSAATTAAHSAAATAAEPAAACTEMTVNRGLGGRFEKTAFIPFDDFFNGALLFRKYIDPGSRKRLNGIRPDMTGNYGFNIFTCQELSCLNPGPASQGGAPVVKSLITHICGVNDQKTGATTKSRVERRIQGFAGRTNSNFHIATSFSLFR
jgi:hypothetical protein